MGDAIAERQGPTVWPVHDSFGSVVAHVVEVSIGTDGLPKVEPAVTAVDCGQPMNPDVIRAQMDGGLASTCQLH
jgi:CO/xanthine dehydrogenase Mo-binding subunit